MRERPVRKDVVGDVVVIILPTLLGVPAGMGKGWWLFLSFNSPVLALPRFFS